jgi:hypothetical protein
MKSFLDKFDKFLLTKNLKFEAIAIGATPLILMDVISRRTRDVDFIDPKIPKNILDASIEFSHLYDDLRDDWFNNGPISIIENLTVGWRNRIIKIFTGEALNIYTLGRMDLLKTKLFAYCDRAKDFDDCIALAPTESELFEAIDWVKDQDINPDWPKHVEEAFSDLKSRLK